MSAPAMGCRLAAGLTRICACLPIHDQGPCHPSHAALHSVNLLPAAVVLLYVSLPCVLYATHCVLLSKTLA